MSLADLLPGPVADLLPGRLGPASRLPDRLDDLRGPAKGVITLPKYLAWPGMRECDVGDDTGRRTLYAMLLAKGKRNDIVRLVNAGLLGRDWPQLRSSLDQRLRRRCERQLDLVPAGGPADQDPAGQPDLEDPGVTADVTSTQS